MTLKVDFLIIGSGIAGLSFALKVAPFGKVCMITKSSRDESNTKYAQGGIAAVLDSKDSFEQHIADTLAAGAGINDEKVVRSVVQEAPARIAELLEYGARFDRNAEGHFDLGKEGGHSAHRILHHKDNTGYEVERALLAQVQQHPNIEILDHHFAVEIITQHHLGHYVNSTTPDITCFGAYVLDLHSGSTSKVLSKVTLMATGGAGHVYSSTTNPTIATGDGVAMVYRAKGRVEGMEFIQFHPTAFYEPGVSPSFLLTEALRGAGAVLRNLHGHLFMADYHPQADLAPRDIVARAIDREMKVHGHDHVWLDCTGIASDILREKFPNINHYLQTRNLDFTRQWVPVTPSCHYICGGIKVDLQARSSIHRLLAAGECASTGLHGANRLASNSLLEAVVYAHRAAQTALEIVQTAAYRDDIPEWRIEGTAHPEELILITQSKKELQAIMSNYVGIVRSQVRLQRAYDRMLILNRETETLYQRSTLSKELCELRNLILVGYLIVKAAMARKESVGLHYLL